MEITSTKRIAVNTLFLYFRMLLSMGISLYTSRVVLDALGVIDYGIYNVVGGLTTMFVFFSSALTNATQRFLNFELGVNSPLKINQVFSLSLLVFSLISITVVFCAVPIGSWFIDAKLVIPVGMYDVAKIILYTVIFSLVFTLLGSVYEAVLIARENMRVYAYIGIIDVFFKLGIAFLVKYIDNDRLIVYSILVSIAIVLNKIIMMWYCWRKYDETHFKFYWNGLVFKEMFGFAGWNIYGCGVWMLNEQGINILLNIFFSPVVNAARGLAMQMNTALNQFGVSFYTAVRPQIIKNYAACNYNEFSDLVYRSGRFSFYLMWILCTPIMLRPSFILDLWLKDVPDYTSQFLVLVLVFSLINTFNNPLWTAIQAVGHLKKISIYGSTFYLLAFPLGYMVLKIGQSPISVFYVLIFVRCFYLIIAASILGGYTSINLYEFLGKIVSPAALVSVASLILILPLNKFFSDNFIGFSLISLCSIILNSIIILFIGMQKDERNFVCVKLRNWLNR